MKRFQAFSEAQARELAQVMNDHWRRVAVVFVMLLVAISVGFGYGLKKVGDSSDHADSALRAANQVIRDRAADAKKTALENAKKAQESAEAAYSACRRQQESTIAARLAVHVLLADPDPNMHRLAVKYHRFLEAQHLLDIPECPKPPKGS